MIIKAKIAKVGELREGLSETTGKPWSQRRILLAFNDDEGDEYLMVGVDKDVWQNLGIQEGEEATVHLKFYTKRYLTDYVKNIIRIVQPSTEEQP